MRGNLSLLIDNLHDVATLTASSEGLPVINTQDQRRDYVWESVDAAVQTITCVLPNAEYADVFAMSRYNLTAAATVRLILKSDGATVYDSNAVEVVQFIPAGVWRAGIDPWMAAYNDILPAQVLVISFPSVVFDEYQIVIDDTANPDGFLHVSRIAIGQQHTLDINFSNGAVFEWIENERHTRMTGGGLYTSGDTGGRARRIKLDLDHLSELERIDLDVKLTAAGQGRDVLVRAYPGTGDVHELLHTFFAKRTSSIGITHHSYDHYSLPLIYEEC